MWSELIPKYDAAVHWAKLEIPEEFGDKVELRERLKGRFPVERFNELRRAHDPKGILANSWIQGAFGNSRQAEESS